jgi:foldase protein PrsA
MKNKKQNTESKWNKKSIFIISIILLIVISICAYFYFKSEIVATVNGEKISEKRLDALYNSLPFGTNLTKKATLSQLIDTKVLIDYIQDEGYELSESDFQKQLNLTLKSTNLSMNELLKQLSMRGATIQDVKENMMIQLYVKNVLDKRINVTQSQLNLFKSENPNSNLTTLEIVRKIYTLTESKMLQAMIKLHKPSVNIVISDKYK